MGKKPKGGGGGGGRGKKGASDDGKSTTQRKKEERELKKQLRKQNASCKFGSEEERKFGLQLAGLGCWIKEMSPDGNCMFRSLADQVEGRPQNHSEYRHRIMNFVEEHRDDFEPFMEEDEKFDDYMTRMRQERQWGGHHELYAASRLLKSNIVIHQFDAPRFEIHADGATNTLHLSYHGEFHYNSVRAKDDPGTDGQPPHPIDTLGLAGSGRENGDKKGGHEDEEEEEQQKDIDMVSKCVPAASREEILQALQSCDGDRMAAVEYLLAPNPSPPPPPTNNNDNGQGSAEKHEGDDAIQGEGDDQGEGGDDDSCGSAKGIKPPAPPPNRGKKVGKGGVVVATRGGPCPCGSGIKYKKCCRSRDKAKASGKASQGSSTKETSAVAVVEDKLRAIVI